MANIQAPPYLANNSVRNDSEMLIRRSLDRFLLLMMRFPLNIVTEAKNQAALSKHAYGAGCPRQTDRILHSDELNLRRAWNSKLANDQRKN